MSQTGCPPEVYATLRAIHEGGAVNMFNIETVRKLAADRNANETVRWIEENQDSYLELVASWP